jgi:site-specific DNA-methyltransferase (adenine-specific)
MEELINNISLGDCFELMPKIPDKSIDMILCDLPYMIMKLSWDRSVKFDLTTLWKEYERIIKPNGAIVLTACSEFTFKLYNSNPKLYRYKWIWIKSRACRFLSTKHLPLATTEDVLVFYKELPTYNPQMRKGFNPYFKERKANSKFTELFGGKHRHTISRKEDGSRHPIDVLRFSSVNNQYLLHPTQKPVALFEYMIKTYTNENELVLDNCSGSGTTAIACLKTNRRYICIEKDEKYHKLSIDRVNAFKQKLEQGLEDE